MEKLEVGSITYTPNYPNNLDDVLDSFRMLQRSSDAGWQAFFKVDYQLEKIKDCLCKDCLLKVEALNGKEILRTDRRGNRKVGKKVRSRK